jgi:hypothetical protein
MHDTSPVIHEASPSCRNCAAELSGPYCAQCGQHAHDSGRSLHVLFHEAWHLLTHLDGRLWRTLQWLLLRPGRLTLEYFADRRARYVPPFQLYFVISVAFFGLAALTNTLSGVRTSTSAAPLTEADRAELQQPGTPAFVAATVEAATAGHSMTAQTAAQLCGYLTIGTPWVTQRLQFICRHQLADQGKSMMHEFGALVPKMMFVFLPLMALVMLALYHSPPRFYVEHLVFFLHLQSDLFLLMIVQMLLLALTDALPALAAVSSISGTVLFCYAAWYVYAALHRYYGQSSTRTFGKFTAVVIAYLVCFGLTLAGTAILSALVT